jgi:predicted restriction endonuclease
MYNRLTDPKHKKWAKEVKARDDFTCQICGKQGVYLNSHHIYSFAHYKDKRFDVDNGITLCVFHHEMFHKIYGHGANDEFQFKQYVSIMKILRKIAEDNFDD